MENNDLNQIKRPMSDAVVIIMLGIAAIFMGRLAMITGLAKGPRSAFTSLEPSLFNRIYGFLVVIGGVALLIWGFKQIFQNFKK